MVADQREADITRLLLIQFTRTPQVGQVKTRLLPVLSAVEACELHSELTLWTCRQLLASGLGEVELSVAGNTQHALFEQCLAAGAARVSQQRGANLGQRMFNAIDNGLAQYDAVILVGSDCPGIDVKYLESAARTLATISVVLGPATDGGYVLIGARDITASVFRDIPWGSAQVYEKTLGALNKAGLTWQALPPLSDIDRPEDLPLWDAIRNAKALTGRSD